jgi:hypothetical protein
VASSPTSTEPADFVYSRNALHHLPDFFKALALARIASILKAGGALRLHDLVFSFDPPEAEHVIEAWLASAVEQPERGFTRAEIEKDIRGEHITFSWLLEPMLERAGFTIQDARHHASRCYSAYTCLKAHKSQSELPTRLPTIQALRRPVFLPKDGMGGNPDGGCQP